MDLRDTAPKISVTSSPTTPWLIARKTRACAQTKLRESEGEEKWKFGKVWSWSPPSNVGGMEKMAEEMWI